MRFTSTVPVAAAPDAVFALINDVERVATCMPGAVLQGRDGEAWHGGVKVKVGPVTAAYAGTVRFLEVDPAQRTLRVQAKGTDTHGSGDAEAEVTLEVRDDPAGARLELVTDLVIRGKIAQFGKGAITAVSDRILRQFARNLGGLLEGGDPAPALPNATTAASARGGTGGGTGAGDSGVLGDGTGDGGRHLAAVGTVRTGPAAAHADAGGHPVSSSGTPAFQPVAGPELDGLALLGGPAVAKYAPIVGAFAFGLFEGWLLGRLVSVERQLRQLRAQGKA
ncbi:SRPBCC family protein [Yinghuangia soli]|uniref:SRPBCC family protein n=1 Tax=Yinghuangia soli TaxID=2908204 RepID=A0AA41PYJ0_9ACTN|nr:SRPBCC family protein [Yinghuangia soli]MCF2527947.1 SRPBCC family protein [Yinghuangia soli]